MIASSFLSIGQGRILHKIQPDLQTKIIKLSLFSFADWLFEPGNNSCVVVHVY